MEPTMGSLKIVVVVSWGVLGPSVGAEADMVAVVFLGPVRW